ncbi:unnamed protein product [Thelazia callipaeda]|uniref:Charged multivesicular body protein 6 n=1 Tax=Thelazia callipaeda TaxID=103827 RepID=A0A158RCW8_THECL|nr:unnamed protein product [Thelazia callipaeda]
MGNLFGKRPRQLSLPPISQQDQAILSGKLSLQKLKNQRDKMKQYMRRNEKQMERDKELAKRLIRANKKDEFCHDLERSAVLFYSRALLVLKKKKYQESVIVQTLHQLDKVERMVNDLEFAIIEQKVVEQLRIGNEALKQMNQVQFKISVNSINTLEISEKEKFVFQEISNMLSGKLDRNNLEEVENELSKLIEENVLDLPEVPSEPVLSETFDGLSKFKALILKIFQELNKRQLSYS